MEAIKQAAEAFREERTLMGVHNISEDKLKKALKQGGLANPSMAVFDTRNYAQGSRGDSTWVIAVIIPKYLSQ